MYKHGRLIVTRTATNKVLTASDVVRVDTVANNLVPDSSRWTEMLATYGKHRDWVPVSALDVLGRVIVWEVVAERHYVVVGTRTGQATAELSDCSNTHTHTRLTALCPGLPG